MQSTWRKKRHIGMMLGGNDRHEWRECRLVLSQVGRRPRKRRRTRGDRLCGRRDFRKGGEWVLGPRRAGRPPVPVVRGSRPRSEEGAG